MPKRPLRYVNIETSAPRWRLPKRFPELGTGRRRSSMNGEEEMESTLERFAQEEEVCAVVACFRDAVTGQSLDQALVRDARRE